MISVITFAILFIVSSDCLLHQNNVCKSFRDYATISDNKNCWYNPDVGSSPKLMAKRLGYPFEEHTVTTEDGYLLTMHRIPRGIKNKFTGKPRTPVLIQHGAAGSSAFWVLQGNRSLAFMIADNGYDVWMLNARGTYYSTKHQTLHIEDPAFWNFGLTELNTCRQEMVLVCKRCPVRRRTHACGILEYAFTRTLNCLAKFRFHEIAVYDLPASIDFIANKTNQKGNLIYIGHSMGTTISFIYAITKKRHAEENLKGLISLAPVAYMKHVQGGFKLLAPSFELLSKLVRSSGLEAVGQFHQLQNLILRLTCGHFPFIITCNSVLELFSGVSPGQLKPEILPVFLSYYPSGLSIKTLGHFVQLINTGEFRHYDHGPKKNVQVYMQKIPPEYDVNSINLPVHLFVGEHDIVGNLQDAEILRDKINTGKLNTQADIYRFSFAHNDFFLGKDLEPFYQKLFEVLQLLSNNNVIRLN